MTDFLNFDLCKTSDLVSSGELSAGELTNAAIDRAEALQPKLNSFISLEKDIRENIEKAWNYALKQSSPEWNESLKYVFKSNSK